MKPFKPQLYVVLIIAIFYSCNQSKKEETPEKSTTNIKHTHTETLTNNSSRNQVEGKTLLCEINDEPWSYTEASGLVSRNKQTNKRIAIVTFKNRLEKGTESIQLTYDADNLQLEEVSMQLKRIKTNGERLHAIYTYHPRKAKTSPEVQILGTINLTDTDKLSGHAEISNIKINHQEQALKNSEDVILQVTDLKFSGVPYTDLEKALRGLNK